MGRADAGVYQATVCGGNVSRVGHAFGVELRAEPQ